MVKPSLPLSFFHPFYSPSPHSLLSLFFLFSSASFPPFLTLHASISFPLNAPFFSPFCTLCPLHPSLSHFSFPSHSHFTILFYLFPFLSSSSFLLLPHLHFSFPFPPSLPFFLPFPLLSIPCFHCISCSSPHPLNFFPYSSPIPKSKCFVTGGRGHKRS